jgi:hypothetical protein
VPQPDTTYKSGDTAIPLLISSIQCEGNIILAATSNNEKMIKYRYQHDVQYGTWLRLLMDNACNQLLLKSGCELPAGVN